MQVVVADGTVKLSFGAEVAIDVLTTSPLQRCASKLVAGVHGITAFQPPSRHDQRVTLPGELAALCFRAVSGQGLICRGRRLRMGGSGCAHDVALNETGTPGMVGRVSLSLTCLRWVEGSGSNRTMNLGGRDGNTITGLKYLIAGRWLAIDSDEVISRVSVFHAIIKQFSNGDVLADIDGVGKAAAVMVNEIDLHVILLVVGNETRRPTRCGPQKSIDLV